MIVQFSCLRIFYYCLWLFAGLFLAANISSAEIKRGDILVADQFGGATGNGALFLVHPDTGHRTVLSDFGDPSQGSQGQFPTGVAVGAGGRIFVSTLFGPVSFFAGALFEVDPNTGNRTLLSDFSQGDIQGNLYNGLKVDAKSKVIANLQFGSPSWGIVRISPGTDNRIIVSDISNPGQGVTLNSPSQVTDLAIERSGEILIGASIYFNNDTSEKSAIFRINPITGNRTLLSDFANSAQGDIGDFAFNTGLAVECSGKILVASDTTRNLLFRVHPKTGKRTVLSDFDNTAQGPVGSTLYGVAVDGSRQILVGAYSPITNAVLLFKVDPATGRRIVFSDSGNPAQGSPISTIIYIAVVPMHKNDYQDSD